ncbi:hypothetical protein BJX64DRAFT_271346, partial [Aspergillus heterothallicus]
MQAEAQAQVQPQTNTPLSIAVDRERVDIADLLFSRGADPTTRSSVAFDHRGEP